MIVAAVSAHLARLSAGMGLVGADLVKLGDNGTAAVAGVDKVSAPERVKTFGGKSSCTGEGCQKIVGTNDGNVPLAAPKPANML